MKIIINTSACVGHARCQMIAPALHTLDGNGYNTLTRSVDVPLGMEALATRSVRACPERALTIMQAPDTDDQPAEKI